MSSSYSDSDLLARSEAALKGFLIADLKLGFQFANSALFYRRAGELELSQRNRQAALRVVKDVGYFQRRLPAADFWLVTRYRARLERYLARM